MSLDIKIGSVVQGGQEDEIPDPPSRWKYPWDQLEPKDRFAVRCREADVSRVKSALRDSVRRYREIPSVPNGYEIRIIPTDNGVEVWRVK